MCTILNSSEKCDHIELTGVTDWGVARMQMFERSVTLYAFAVSSQTDAQNSGV
jgi:hypothetical protein